MSDSTGETKEGTVPFPFPQKDTILEEVEKQLNAHPEKRAEIQRLLSTPLARFQEETIAVGCYDIRLLLQSLIGGRLPHDQEYPDHHILSIIWGNPFWNQEVYGLTDQLPPAAEYYQEIKQRVGHEDIAFRTAFATHVLPVLKPDWLNDRTNLTSDESLTYHNFVEELTGELREAGTKKLTASSIYHSQLVTRPYIYTLLHQVSDQYDYQQVYDFLVEAEATRKGVIVGYNSRVLQGEWVQSHLGEPSEKHFDKQGITSSDEVAIKTENSIDLSVHPITAIEILGNYEDEVARQLKII